MPLAGLRVLDFTVMPPGGACTVMLADLGAEVIRVEPPSQTGKPSLVIGQVALSRGKRSMTLDMRAPASADVLRQIAPSVDIIVENARPGAMASRGFGYQEARNCNRGLIWCAITGFGQTGPYAEYAGHDLSYLAHSGLLTALTGKPEPGERPWQPGLSLALQAGALSAVIAIQAALIARGRSGEGAFIDLSLSEAAGWFLTCGIDPLSARPLVLPSSPDRRLYACADRRWVAVACAEPRTWAALCDVLDVPELKPSLRQANRVGEIGHKLEAIFATRSASEWIERVSAAGGAITIVNHGAQLLDDPHVQARGSVVDVAGSPVAASPIRIAAGGLWSGSDTAPPHCTGEDTDTVLRSAGFDDDAIAGMRADGLI